MRYQISGKQIDIGEALQTHVKAELGEVVEKYAQRPTEAVIVFSRSAHEFVCETVIHLATGLNAQAKGHATEIYAAFESCREKMDKQLRRYKRRLRNHHRDRPQPVEFGAGASYILAPTEEPDEADTEALQPVKGRSRGNAMGLKGDLTQLLEEPLLAGHLSQDAHRAGDQQL